MLNFARPSTPFRAALVAAAVFLLAANASAQAPADVVWTNLVHASASGTMLQKTSGCNGCWDAGGTSLQALQTAEGYVEFAPLLGGRLIAGLGGSQSPGTDPALIDFAFGFWPDGGWDIRERSVYRTEGRFDAGDVFRIALVDGVVKYYRNGSLVYTSAVAPTLPLVLDATLHSAGATLTSASLTADGPPAFTPPPAEPLEAGPSTYEAVTDRQTREKGPTPELGPAGYVFQDPAFGTRIQRVTDGATRPDAPDRSYRTPSATHSNAWSADSRYFYTVSTDGTILPYAFDPAAMTASRLEPTATGAGGRTLRFFAEPTFSYVTPGVLYGTYNGPGSNLRSVDAYDIESREYTRIVDLDSVVAGLTGTYTGGILNSGGPSERIVAFFGGTGQDRHMYLVVFDRHNPDDRRLVDTLASTVDGATANITLNFSIHAAAIDRSGRYVTIYPTSTDLQAPRSAAPAYVWDTATNVFTATPLAQARSGGHDAYGYGVRVNQDCCTASTWDAAQWQFRSLASPLATADLIAPVLLPQQVYLADHPSWHNARPDRLVPFLNANYRYGANTTAWRAWDEEIFAVQTDAPGSGGLVWRFAHHRSVVASDVDASRISFWYTPRVNVSLDGRWALFTSNWDKTLGIDPRADAGGASRQDLFLIDLRGSQPPDDPLDPVDPIDPVDPVDPVEPIAVVTVSLPDATRDSYYEERLLATGGEAPLTWSIVSGSLPQGLVLDEATGVISGVTLDQGMFRFTVRAVGASASPAGATQALRLKVNRK